MHRVLPRSTLALVDNTGHCPHLSAPSASADAINGFIASLSL
jgi:sigma-B regulation protein RsbQ